MPFEWHSSSDRGRGSRGMFVAIDRQQRFCLSTALRRELGCLGNPISLYVGYDKVNRRIALAKPDVVRLTDTRPYRFDARGYAAARSFVDKFRLPKDRVTRFYYDGKENGAWTFRMENYDAPDDQI